MLPEAKVGKKAEVFREGEAAAAIFAEKGRQPGSEGVAAQLLAAGKLLSVEQLSSPYYFRQAGEGRLKLYFWRQKPL